MAFQAFIGRHFKDHFSRINEYLDGNNLVLEELNGEEFVRKRSDPAGYKRYTFLQRKNGHPDVYIGKVADPTEDNLEAELQGVSTDLPGSTIHFW